MIMKYRKELIRKYFHKKDGKDMAALRRKNDSDVFRRFPTFSDGRDFGKMKKSLLFYTFKDALKKRLNKHGAYYIRNK